MASESAFYEAVFPAPARVLGLSLKPFCLGHRILLHRFGSVFILGDGAEPVTYDDLALSVFICHHSYEDACAALAAPDLDRIMLDWERQLERPTFLHRIGLRKPEVIPLQPNAEKFAAYVNAAHKTPYYTYDPNKCSSVAAPLDQLLLTSLMSDTHMTMSEILNMPYSLALHVWVTRKAQDGAVTLADKTELDNARAFGDELEKMLKEQGVKVG